MATPFLASSRDVPPRDPPSVPLDSSAPPPSSVRKIRVLIVEDDHDLAEVLEMALLDFGYEIKGTLDPLEALTLVGTFMPDIALLDIGLPRMNGYELAQRLREQTNLPGLRLVALTGYAGEPHRARAEIAGFDAFLVKPFDFDVLERTLAEVRQP